MIGWIKKLLNYTIIRYSFGGVLAALIDLFCLRLFTQVFGLYYLFSALLSFVVSFFFGYFFQKYITFQNFSKKHIVQGGLFLLFQLVGQGIYMVLLWIGVDYLFIYYMYVAIFAKFIAFIRNYITNYYLNFKQ